MLLKYKKKEVLIKGKYKYLNSFYTHYNFLKLTIKYWHISYQKFYTNQWNMFYVR